MKKIKFFDNFNGNVCHFQEFFKFSIDFAKIGKNLENRNMHLQGQFRKLVANFCAFGLKAN